MTSTYTPPPVGPRIANARKVANLTQAFVASKVGLTQPGLSEIERGERMPSVKSIILIANALGVSVARLLER